MTRVGDFSRQSADIQTLLGRSYSDHLTIIKPPPSLTKIPDGGIELPLSPGNGIFGLPDELLLQIFTIATRRSDSKSDRQANDRRTCNALSTTCRRFNNIVTLILYSDIYICKSLYGWNSISLRRAIRCLHCTLKKKPSLWKHCYSLSILVGNSTGDAPLAPYLKDFVVWLANTRKLSIHGDFEVDEEKWSLLKAAVQHMPLLEEVSLSWGLSLKRVCETVTSLSHLRVLEFSGIRCHDISLPWESIKVSGYNIFITQNIYMLFLSFR